MINIKPSANNLGKTIKKSLLSKISTFARNNNILELTYTVFDSDSIQSALVTYDGQTQSKTNEDIKQQEIIISEDGHFSHDVSSIKDLLLQQNCLTFTKEEDNQDFIYEEKQQITPPIHFNNQDIQTGKKEDLQINKSDFSQSDVYDWDEMNINTIQTEKIPNSIPSLEEQISNQTGLEINLNEHNTFSLKANNFVRAYHHNKNENKIKIIDSVQHEEIEEYFDSEGCIQDIQDRFHYPTVEEEEQQEQELQKQFFYKLKFEHNHVKIEREENKTFTQKKQRETEEDSEKEKKYLKFNEKLSNNKDLTENFKTIQTALFEKIKQFDYFLESYIQTIENVDIFEGKYKSRTIVFKILYGVERIEFEKDISIIKEVETVSKSQILINSLQLEGGSYVFVFFKNDYLEFDELLKMIKEKQQNLEKFNSRNYPIFDRQIDQENIKQFRKHQDLILESLKKHQYFLNKFLAQGGEGLIFDGYKQYTICNYLDFAFKVVFDISKSDIDEEVKIMKSFEKNINTIKLFDIIEVSDEVSVFVLEKCKYSLQHLLQKFSNKEIEFTEKKLFQIITNLLDGLIQFRIYNILHLDIKPQNILVNESDDYVFTDFGISSFLKDKRNVQVKGYTPYYAPSEQIASCLANEQQVNNNNNSNNISYLSDVFSLGKTFIQVINVYKLVTPKADMSALEQLIKDSMVGPKQFLRKDCITLYQLFYQYFSTTSFKEYLKEYSNQIDQVLNLEQYDNKKDIPHFLDILLCYQLIQLDIQQNHSNQPKDSPVIAKSLNKIAQTYDDLAQFEKAFKFRLEALTMTKKVLKGDHLEIADLLDSVGSAYKKIGQNEKALEYKLEGLEMKKRLFKYFHESIASSLNSVGYTYQDLGQNWEALKYKQEALEVSEHVYGKKDHHKKAVYLASIGSTFEDLGKNEDSLAVSLKALNMFERLYKGDDHPSIAGTLLNIGHLYLAIGDTEKALEYQQRSIAMMKKIYKGDHNNISTSLTNIGAIYQSKGENEEAFLYLLQALEMNRKLFIGDHPDIATSLANIGSMYDAIDDLKMALIYQLEGLEMRRKLFENNHPSIKQSLKSLSSVYSQIGDTEKANQYSLELQILVANTDRLLGHKDDH